MSCCYGIAVTEHPFGEAPTTVCADCGRNLGGYVPGDVELVCRVDPDQPTMTAAEVQATGVLDDVTLYRYDPEPVCEHGATFTFRHGVIGGHHVTFDAPLTYCLACHQLTPTPQEDPQP